MRKFVVVAVFAAVIVFLIVFASITRTRQPVQKEIVKSVTVKPVTNIEQEEEETVSVSEKNADITTTLIKLQPNEILLNIIATDINGDTFDDQIISIKRAGVASVILITGIYNSDKAEYQRVSEIETGVTQANTFSFSITDLIGDHSNVLVYTGLNNSGESILKAYKPSSFLRFKFNYDLIADLKTDGNIFIQQSDRSDAYSMFKTQGESFPIWVYSSDTSRGLESLDQIQTMWDWSFSEKKYVIVSQTRVNGKKIAANELNRILDGTPETFENFLSGLWYKTPSSGNNLRYIFFNADDKEIILSFDKTQELYGWTASSLTKNGIHITSMSKSINNLIRQFNITLNGLDEIKLRVNDDVKMYIKEETLWDGTYKKISLKANSYKEQTASQLLKQIESNSQIWTTSDNMSVTIKKSQFFITNDEKNSSGIITETVINNEPLLEFRTLQGETLLKGHYKAELETTDTENSTTETLLLYPVNISIKGFSLTGEAPVRFERSIEK
ncbi:MAG: pallilysin-related adhesin [Spirochaetaceae bacterium]|nr:pallilysin-related adhesin [Spirochaetaceae bacterium]MBP5329178.1 pallilysin-related adhesin [Spirochaetaceae bacterium]